MINGYKLCLQVFFQNILAYAKKQKTKNNAHKKNE